MSHHVIDAQVSADISFELTATVYLVALEQRSHSCDEAISFLKSNVINIDHNSAL
jgi:hypothetical protein